MYKLHKEFDRALLKYNWLRWTARTALSIVTAPYGGWGGAAFDAHMVRISGGNLKEIVKTAAMSYATSLVYQGIDVAMPEPTYTKVLVSGIAGGSLSRLQGGSFRDGFLWSAGTEFAGKLYYDTLEMGIKEKGPNAEKNLVTGETKGQYADPRPGDNSLVEAKESLERLDGEGTYEVAVHSFKANNWGHAQHENVCYEKGIPFTLENGRLSRVMNRIPGMNAVSTHHDITVHLLNNRGIPFKFQNVPTMPISGLITYGSMLRGELSVYFANQ